MNMRFFLDMKMLIGLKIIYFNYKRMIFYIPPVFLFGNKVRHIRNNQEKNKAEYKTATGTGIQIENRNIKRIEELEKENKKLKIIIENNDLEQKADWKYIEELEEKYEKLKADYIKLSKIVEVGWGYRASYVNGLRDKIAKLEQELKIWMLTAKDYARLQWVDLEDSPRL